VKCWTVFSAPRAKRGRALVNGTAIPFFSTEPARAFPPSGVDPCRGHTTRKVGQLILHDSDFDLVIITTGRVDRLQLPPTVVLSHAVRLCKIVKLFCCLAVTTSD